MLIAIITGIAVFAIIGTIATVMVYVGAKRIFGADVAKFD